MSKFTGKQPQLLGLFKVAENLVALLERFLRSLDYGFTFFFAYLVFHRNCHELLCRTQAK